MKAMIFAAGLGTRLQPLTNNKPKALVEIGGHTLLEIAIRKLVSFGFDDIVVNIHHFGEQIIDFLKNNTFGAKITISDERSQLLDTGGALAKAAHFFNDNKPFLVYNVDIITNSNLLDFYNYHILSDSIATLMIRQRKSSRYLLFDNDLLLCGWQNNQTNEKIIVTHRNISLHPFAFSGIHVIDPKIFNYFQQQSKFSIIPFYLQIASKEKINGYDDKSEFWFDLGKHEHLIQVSELINERKDFKLF